MSTKTAKTYWKAQQEYPFPFTKRRRLHELNYLIPRIEEIDCRTLLDIGCGDGSLVECLLRLTDIEQFYGYDIASELLEGIDPRVETAVYDISNPGDLPLADATVIGGVIQYTFEDDVVDAFLERLTSSVIWVRSTCTLQPQAEEVDRDGYASKYRTVPETYSLLSQHYLISAVDRIYPDEIESKYGTKQFYFTGRRRI